MKKTLVIIFVFVTGLVVSARISAQDVGTYEVWNIHCNIIAQGPIPDSLNLNQIDGAWYLRLKPFKNIEGSHIYHGENLLIGVGSETDRYNNLFFRQFEGEGGIHTERKTPSRCYQAGTYRGVKQATHTTLVIPLDDYGYSVGMLIVPRKDSSKIFYFQRF